MVLLVGGPAVREARAMASPPVRDVQGETSGGVVRVAISGEDLPGCGAQENPCRTVQHAVSQALPNDEIRVAAGTYTGTNNYGGLSQVVFLSKTLTVRGGYTTTNWNVSDPEVNPTTLDAEGKGRVLVISDTITVHLEGLRFQGGDATGLGGGLAPALTGGPTISDAGGGLYMLTATVTISNSLVISNTASTGSERPGCGGGFYVQAGSVTLVQSEVVSNTAGTNVYSYGGGLYIDHGSAALLHNLIMSNTASLRDDGYGGGLYLYGGAPTEPPPKASLLDNRFQGNYASRQSDGQGGGMYANHYDVELLDNLIQYNTGGMAKEGKGGGLYIVFSSAVLEDNMVRYNVANRGIVTPEPRSEEEEEEEAPEGISGGVHFCTCGDVTLRSNTIFSNTACIHGHGYGGGVSFCKTEATLDSNQIISNTATFSTVQTVRGWGGGVWTGDNASLSMSNDLIAGNHAKTQGGGLWLGVENEGYNPRGHWMQHVTIAHNGGDHYYAHGLYVTNTMAFLTNTIIAGHADFGVYVPTGGEATLEATLWHENRIDHTYGSNIETGEHSYHGDPAFADPGAWDYHIGEGSAALDLGVATGVRRDMDGERRAWQAPDLGADEYWPPGVAIRAYLPLVLQHWSQE
jgi:hypothetical protein